MEKYVFAQENVELLAKEIIKKIGGNPQAYTRLYPMVTKGLEDAFRITPLNGASLSDVPRLKEYLKNINKLVIIEIVEQINKKKSSNVPKQSIPQRPQPQRPQAQRPQPQRPQQNPNVYNKAVNNLNMNGDTLFNPSFNNIERDTSDYASPFSNVTITGATQLDQPTNEVNNGQYNQRGSGNKMSQDSANNRYESMMQERGELLAKPRPPTPDFSLDPPEIKEKKRLEKEKAKKMEQISQSQGSNMQGHMGTGMPMDMFNSIGMEALYGTPLGTLDNADGTTVNTSVGPSSQSTALSNKYDQMLKERQMMDINTNQPVTNQQNMRQNNYQQAPIQQHTYQQMNQQNPTYQQMNQQNPTYQQPTQSTYQQPTQSTYQQPTQSTYQQPQQHPNYQQMHQPQAYQQMTQQPTTMKPITQTSNNFFFQQNDTLITNIHQLLAQPQIKKYLTNQPVLVEQILNNIFFQNFVLGNQTLVNYIISNPAYLESAINMYNNKVNSAQEVRTKLQTIMENAQVYQIVSHTPALQQLVVTNPELLIYILSNTQLLSHVISNPAIINQLEATLAEETAKKEQILIPKTLNDTLKPAPITVQPLSNDRIDKMDELIKKENELKLLEEKLIKLHESLTEKTRADPPKPEMINQQIQTTNVVIDSNSKELVLPIPNACPQEIYLIDFKFQRSQNNITNYNNKFYFATLDGNQFQVEIQPDNYNFNRFKQVFETASKIFELSLSSDNKLTIFHKEQQPFAIIDGPDNMNYFLGIRGLERFIGDFMYIADVELVMKLNYKLVLYIPELNKKIEIDGSKIHEKKKLILDTPTTIMSNKLSIELLTIGDEKYDFNNTFYSFTFSLKS